MTWTGFALCFLAFCGLCYIRWICFRRPMPEDWVMLVAMLGSSIVIQLLLEYAFEIGDLAGGAPPPPAVLDDVHKAVRGLFAQIMIT